MLAIRDAESGRGSGDHDFIAKITARLFLQYGSYDAYLTEWLQDEHVGARIAWLDDVRAGFHLLAVYADGAARVSELLAIGVVPELQHRGVGAGLLDDALARAEKASAVEVRLSVAEGNARAQRLFASRGFRLTEGHGVYPSGQRALLMARSLRPGESRRPAREGMES